MFNQSTKLNPKKKKPSNVDMKSLSIPSRFIRFLLGYSHYKERRDDEEVRNQFQ